MELPKCNFKGNLAYVESGQEAQEQRLAGCLISCGSFFWEGEGKGENPTAHVLKTFHQTDHSSQPESKSPFCSSYDKYTELWLNGYSELGIWGIPLCSTKLSPVERERQEATFQGGGFLFGYWGVTVLLMTHKARNQCCSPVQSTAWAAEPALHESDCNKLLISVLCITQWIKHSPPVPIYS